MQTGVRWLLAAVITLAPLGVVVVDVAAQSGGQIHACIKDPDGDGTGRVTRIVGENEPCKRGETRVTWNAVGAQGPQGDPGAAGAAGPNGATGPAGAPGPQGAAGATGAAGAAGARGPQGQAGLQGAQGPSGGVMPTGYRYETTMADAVPNGEIFRNASLPAGNYLVTAEVTFRHYDSIYPVQAACSLVLSGATATTGYVTISPDTLGVGGYGTLTIRAMSALSGGQTISLSCTDVGTSNHGSIIGFNVDARPIGDTAALVDASPPPAADF